MSFLLDTNVISEWAQVSPSPEVDAWIRSTPAADLRISVISLAEISRGIEKLQTSRRRTELEHWFEDQLLNYFGENALSVSLDVAIRWGRIYTAVERQGRRMEAMDAMIAATAEVHGLTLVTRNTKDFETWGGPVFNPWIETGPS